MCNMCRYAGNWIRLIFTSPKICGKLNPPHLTYISKDMREIESASSLHLQLAWYLLEHRAHSASASLLHFSYWWPRWKGKKGSASALLLHFSCWRTRWNGKKGVTTRRGSRHDTFTASAISISITNNVHGFGDFYLDNKQYSNRHRAMLRCCFEQCFDVCLETHSKLGNPLYEIAFMRVDRYLYPGCSASPSVAFSRKTNWHEVLGRLVYGRGLVYGRVLTARGSRPPCIW